VPSEGKCSADIDAVHVQVDQSSNADGRADSIASGDSEENRRQRLFFVADTQDSDRWPGERPTEAGTGANGERRRGSSSGRTSRLLELPPRDGRKQGRPEPSERGAERGCGTGGMDHADTRECLWREQSQNRRGVVEHGRGVGELGDSQSDGRLGRQDDGDSGRGQRASGQTGEIVRPGPVNGFWRECDWVLTRPQRLGDGPSLRPTRPGAFPLVDGSAFRMGSRSPVEGKSRTQMLRAAGNAIVPQVAEQFIRAYLEVTDASNS